MSRTFISILEKVGTSYTPLVLVSFGKKIAAYLRFKHQLVRTRNGYTNYGTSYSQKILFVAGLPKSGTTWLEKMIYNLPGFNEIMIPEAVYYEQNTGGSHDFDIPENTFYKLDGALAVLKLHVHGSIHNQEVLKRSGLNFVVIYRDLRDVAVSYYFYVRNTPWHPEYSVYKEHKTIQDGLLHFGETLLPEYLKWVESWRKMMSDQCLIIKFEDLIIDTFTLFKKVLLHYRINMSDERITQIVKANSFSKLSQGRNTEEGNSKSFFRKGISGDWKNHFNDDVKELYKNVIGNFLINEGYETNNDW